MERLNYVVIRGPKINYNGSLANFAQVPVILVPSLFFFALKLVCVIKVALQQFFGIYISICGLTSNILAVSFVSVHPYILSPSIFGSCMM